MYVFYRMTNDTSFTAIHTRRRHRIKTDIYYLRWDDDKLESKTRSVARVRRLGNIPAVQVFRLPCIFHSFFRGQPLALLNSATT